MPWSSTDTNKAHLSLKGHETWVTPNKKITDQASSWETMSSPRGRKDDRTRSTWFYRRRTWFDYALTLELVLIPRMELEPDIDRVSGCGFSPYGWSLLLHCSMKFKGENGWQIDPAPRGSESGKKTKVVGLHSQYFLLYKSAAGWLPMQ